MLNTMKENGNISFTNISTPLLRSCPEIMKLIVQINRFNHNLQFNHKDT